MICPRCNAPLPSLLDPCARCGLQFVDSRVVCKRCHIPIVKHRLQCPTPKTEPIPCPLCNGKRHRKTPGSVYECAWRQWENEVGESLEHNDVNEYAFVQWRSRQTDLMAGSIHAERIIRQRKRAAEDNQ